MHILSVHYAEGRDDLPRHDHNHHQLIYIQEGEIRAAVGGRYFSLGSGGVLLLSRFEAHDIAVLSDVYRRYILRIDLAGSGGAANEQLATPIFNRTVDCSPQKGRLDALLAAMVEEGGEGAPFGRHMLDLQLQQLMVLLYRADPTLFPGFTHPNAAVVERLRRRFETDYAADYRMGDLAEACHLSVSHLSHLFKQFIGYSPMAYLTACRLAAACELLTTTDASVNEIVYRCGFGDASNFCRSFKARFGLTPLAFRAQRRR